MEIRLCSLAGSNNGVDRHPRSRLPPPPLRPLNLRRNAPVWAETIESLTSFICPGCSITPCFRKALSFHPPVASPRPDNLSPIRCTYQHPLSCVWWKQEVLEGSGEGVHNPRASERVLHVLWQGGKHSLRLVDINSKERACSG